MKRRTLLLLPTAAMAQKRPDTPEAYALWTAFTEAFNAFAARLNEGVFDTKLWGRVEKTFRRLA